jgi:hypothetical protein
MYARRACASSAVSFSFTFTRCSQVALFLKLLKHAWLSLAVIGKTQVLVVTLMAINQPVKQQKGAPMTQEMIHAMVSLVAVVQENMSQQTDG